MVPNPPLPAAPVQVDVRSYAQDTGAHRHAFAQLVLPLEGSLLIDIAGREGRLDRCRVAFVETGADHSQMSDRPNRSLIVDVDPALIGPAAGERLTRSPFVTLSPAAAKLVDYMGLLMAGGGAPAATLGLWVPLLLDTLAGEAPSERARLGPLLAAVEADPGADWTTATMAARAGVSVSRLHALFRSECDATPHGWLSDLRLRRVCEWLVRTDRSIADLAYHAGYADQSALTRALRRATGLTPAAYRRQGREAGGRSP